MEDHNKMLQRVVLLFVFVFLFLFLAMAGGEDGDSSYDSSSYDGIVVTQADLQALQAFKASLQDPHGALRSWNDSGAGACSGGWLGIKCVRGQVIAIQIPWRGLSGRIAEQVGQLTALRKLNLHDNDLQGPVPSSLAYLRSLRGVYLFNNRLSGIIPPGICNSPVFQALDLRNNLLSGPLPGGLGKSPNLYRVNLSFNNLTGPLPPDLLGSRALVFLHLGRNRFSGALPASVGNMKKLRELGLAHNLLSASSLPAQLGNATSLESLDLSFNSFQGSLPGTLTELGKLKAMNVSYNNLTGPVPPALARKFAPSSFEGNPGLCGYDSAHSCPPSAPSPAPAAPAAPSRRHRRRTLVLVLIIVGSVLGFLILLSLVALLCFCLRRRSEEAPAGGKAGAAAGGPVSGSGSVETGEVDGKLVHFDGPLVFTADDLLCATAEIMGKSTYGTVYKATLEDGNQVAVKRLRERIAKGQREFEAEANALGKIRHPNLLALRAYYWGPKDAKLLVFDYMPNGSLAAFLHARGPETPLNWATRHRIALGAARGLAHLHSQLNIIHGNLNASNILLDSNLTAKIADFGLARLMIPAANNNVIATASALGYKAPELTKVKKANTKTDVYSFGIVLLELLTGKSPAEPMSSENGDMDLPEWVASIVKEQWTNEVFDMEIINESTTGEELIQTLQLAMHCVDPTPSLRPEMDEVVQQLELTGPEPSQQQ